MPCKAVAKPPGRRRPGDAERHDSGGTDRSDQRSHAQQHERRAAGAEADFELAYGATTHNAYGMCAMRHMHDFQNNLRKAHGS